MLSEEFVGDSHSGLTCYDCHEGVAGTNNKEAAHATLIADPSDGPVDQNVCATCHRSKATEFENSLHYTLQGYIDTFESRSGLTAEGSGWMTAFGNHCSGCHATCGQCHISRPTSVNGGLMNEHEYLPTPNQNGQCTACHGSRINDEYKGVHPGLSPDKHYLAGMNCMDCHTDLELHGGGVTPDHRRDAFGRPACDDCHPGPAAGDDDISHHELHAQTVDCPVCHSQPYKNCYQCHVGASDGKSHGLQFPSEIDFRIGKNPIQSSDRPWDYVLLRHVPVYPEMYEAYDITLSNYSALPSWTYATPHNIRRNTPQTESCTNCHGEPGRFLTSAYLDSLIADGKAVAEEITANSSLIVEPPATPVTGTQGGKGK